MSDSADRELRPWPAPRNASETPAVSDIARARYEPTMQLILKRRADEARTPPATPPKPWWSFR